MNDAEVWLKVIRAIILMVVGVPILGVILGHIVVYFLQEFGQLPRTPKGGRKCS